MRARVLRRTRWGQRPLRAASVALVVVVIAGAALLAACSLIVNFVDSCDGGTCADAAVDARPSGDAGDGGSADADAGAFDASRICQGRGDGFYCGYNGLNGQPPPEWRVHCVDGGPVIKVCDAGCLAFPSGYADRCNECPGLPDGVYCGSQFPGYGTSNAPFLMTCGQGIAAIQVLCANGCQEGPGDASCK